METAVVSRSNGTLKTTKMNGCQWILSKETLGANISINGRKYTNF